MPEHAVGTINDKEFNPQCVSYLNISET